jgi:hypothetical protein
MVLVKIVLSGRFVFAAQGNGAKKQQYANCSLHIIIFFNLKIIVNKGDFYLLPPESFRGPDIYYHAPNSQNKQMVAYFKKRSALKSYFAQGRVHVR